MRAIVAACGRCYEPTVPSQTRAPASHPPWVLAPVPAWARGLRAALRLTGVAGWTILAAPVQAACLLSEGGGKRAVPLLYWRWVGRILGLRVRVLGTRARRAPGRPVIFAANHSSWMDIVVLGGCLDACFVAKEEVGGWPVIRRIASLGRTVFVTRRARETRRERDGMRERLLAGDNLILFPEGTSSDGSRVLPFRSAFFSVADPAEGLAPVIQPVSVVYDRLDGLPVGRGERALFAWYGEMELAAHVWSLAGRSRLRATVWLHAPIDPAQFGSRKALCAAVWAVVAQGAAGLRQNREG